MDRHVTAAYDLLGPRDAIDLFYDIFRDQGMYGMVTWNKLYDARLFEGVRHDETMFFGDDANIMDKIYPGNSIVCSNQPLYYYRVRTGSMTDVLFTPRKLDDLKLYGGWVRFFLQQPGTDDLTHWAIARYWQVFYLFYVHANQAGCMTPEVKAGFAQHKKLLNRLVPRILVNPHVPTAEKLRLLPFVISPSLCYRLAAARGRRAEG